VDVLVWMEADTDKIAQRNAEKVKAGEASASLVEDWMAEEATFVADHRTWERASSVVTGTPHIPHDPTGGRCAPASVDLTIGTNIRCSALICASLPPQAGQGRRSTQ
jgi:hypothetical protein